MPPSLRSSKTRSFGHLSPTRARNRGECASHDHADRKRERRELARRIRELPADGQAQAAAERRAPTPPAPAAALALKFGDADVRAGRRGVRKLEQVAIRRADLREYFEARDARRDGVGKTARSDAASSRSIERSSRYPTPGTAATLKPQSLELPHLLPDGRAGNAERVRKLLARVWLTVGQRAK